MKLKVKSRSKIPEEKIEVNADGRLLWRVLRNVFSNVSKYSMDGSRVYIDVVEDGTTFLENSDKKSSVIAEYLKNKGAKDFMVMADDSGIEVDYLNGEPGVYSARYAGVHGNDSENNKITIKDDNDKEIYEIDTNDKTFKKIINFGSTSS